MASCHLSFEECERLYALVVENGDFGAFTKLHDHAVLRLTAFLRRESQTPLRPCDLEDLCEAAFTTTALAFERIPTWRQVISYARKVAGFLLRRQPARPLSPKSVEDHDPPDPKSLAFVSGVEFEDLLSRLGQRVNAAEAAHMAYLVKTAWLGVQSPAALAAELEVSERTLERQRPRVLRKLATLFRDMT